MKYNGDADRARRALKQLQIRTLTHPDVTNVDIGRQRLPGSEKTQIVLRVHVLPRWFDADPAERIAFPAEVEGIPVVVLRGDYQAQQGDAASDPGEGSDQP